jgi:hypothetical protein
LNRGWSGGQIEVLAVVAVGNKIRVRLHSGSDHNEG